MQLISFYFHSSIWPIQLDAVSLSHSTSFTMKNILSILILLAVSALTVSGLALPVGKDLAASTSNGNSTYSRSIVINDIY